MDMSTSVDELLAALSLAQAAIRDAAKDRVNPGAQGAKYATLGSHWDAFREPLTTNGLSLMQFPGTINDDIIEITSILGHKSGQWIKETMTIPLPKETRGGGGGTKHDPQGMGIAITYGRRYAASAIMGTCPDDDEDGEKPGTSKAVAQKAGPPPPTKDQLIDIAKAQRFLKIPPDFPDTTEQAAAWIAAYAKQAAAKKAADKAAKDVEAKPAA